MNRSSALLTAISLALAQALLGGCKADPPPLAAKFDYTMPARFAVPDLEAPEADHEAYVVGELHPDTWLVTLDACPSTGTIVKYTWSIDGSTAGVTTGCDDFDYPFPAEGTYPVSLLVEADDGELSSHTADIVVNDLLVFGVGDSYGSGEGNPDVELSLSAANRLAAARAQVDEAATALATARHRDESNRGVAAAGADTTELPSPAFAEARQEAAEAELAAALAFSSAQWQNQRCHRSAHSGQVRAAKLLEEGDRHTSVTFVHLACSGARVHKGLIGGYLGVEEEEPLLEPQIERVDEIADGREIDALVVSIGGNDVNFANIIEACIIGENCHESPADVDETLGGAVDLVCPILGSFEAACFEYFDELLTSAELDAKYIFDEHSIAQEEERDGVFVDLEQDGNDDLPDNYRELATAIAGLPGIGPGPQQGRVYLTEIPDVTRNQNGVVCGWDAMPLAGAVLYQIPMVTQSELTWASDYITVELRATMRAAATEHGWQFVEGISAAFRRHGYCSTVPWVVRLQNTFLIQGDKNGAVHPNVAGHGAYAEAIATAIAP